MMASEKSSADFWDKSNSIELGKDHSYDLIYGDAKYWVDYWPKKKWSSITRRTNDDGIEEVLTAALIWHRRPDNGENCGVLIHFASPLKLSEKELNYFTWNVKTFDPFEISPSVICRSCDDHGFIREGRWFPA